MIARRDVKSMIGAVLIAVAGTAPAGPAAGSGEDLSRYMRRMAEGGFSGAVLVTRGKDVLLRDAYGLADAELGVPNTPETIFRIGSVTKPLVAAAVMRLVSRGVLGLEDPLARFMPGCPEEWRPVQVVDLLSHTSGIPDLFGDVESGPPGELRELVDKALREAGETALRGEPGSRYAYSNFGYLLLAYVIEVADGRSWLEVLRREVFEPAGLRATRYDSVWELVPGRARGYARKGEELLNTEYKDHGGLSAGGLLSTLDDLGRFAAAVDEGPLLPRELERRMYSPGEGNCALGWQVTRFYDHPVRNHTGGIGGFASHVAAYPESGVFIAVLSNIEDTPVKALACDLAALTFGGHGTVLDGSPAETPAAASLDLMAGTYLGEDGSERTIRRGESSLTLERGEASFPLVPIGGGLFTAEALPGVVLEFEGKPGAPASALVARTCGSEM